MLRRKFLKLLGAAAVVPAIPRTPSAPSLAHDAAHHDLTTGFGLAPVKAEGSHVAFDPMPTEPVKSGILTRADYVKQLQASLNAVFDEHYGNEPPEFKNLVSDESLENDERLG